MIDKATETELLAIIEQLRTIRIKVKENQGQGFLMSAEGNLYGFLSFQTSLPKDITKLVDSKS